MSKINQLITAWPPNTIATSDWLEKQGVYRQLADVYVDSGWIERVERGAYRKAGDTVTWAGGLYALQKLQQLRVHVGGRTALEYHGLGHYIRIGPTHRVTLWKTPGTRLPAWFVNHDWESELDVRTATLFSGNVGGITEKPIEQIPVRLASAERAILEYLYDVPKRAGFDEANYLMEGLTTLRPALLQKLLENCTSVKTKRLFMYLAEHHRHGWFKRLDSSGIDFGKGKREIVKGGKLDKTYQIVVPELSRED